MNLIKCVSVWMQAVFAGRQGEESEMSSYEDS